jgi:hypothetical protein
MRRNEETMETDSVGRGVRKLTVYEEELGN